MKLYGLFFQYEQGPLWPLINSILQKPCIENPLPTVFMANNYVSWPQMIMVSDKMILLFQRLIKFLDLFPRTVCANILVR